MAPNASELMMPSRRVDIAEGWALDFEFLARLHAIVQQLNEGRNLRVVAKVTCV